MNRCCSTIQYVTHILSIQQQLNCGHDVVDNWVIATIETVKTPYGISWRWNHHLFSNTRSTCQDLISSNISASDHYTVFENHRKSLIQHCEGSELRVHFEWTKMPKMVQFGEFLKTWSLRSNSVTRQVSFNRTNIGEKCQNSKIQMRHICEPYHTNIYFFEF